MDLGKAFTYVFEDPNWIMKVLIGGVLLFIPIVNFAVGGYALTTLKNVAEGQPTPMPEWSDFGAHFMKGLYAFVGILVYFLPAIVLYCCLIALGLVAGSTTGAAGTDTGNAVASIVSILALCLNCLLALYSLVAGLTLYAPLTRFAMSENQLSLFWDFRGTLDFIRDNLVNYILALLVGFVASIVAWIGLIGLCVGILFTFFWATMVNSHLFGQLWRNQGRSATAMA